MENMGKEITDFYDRGEKLIAELEKQSELLKSDSESSNEAKEKVLSLNEEKDKLKDEIYNAAKEKSGIDYASDDKNPEKIKEEYQKQLEDLKKRKQELRIQKNKVNKLNQVKKQRLDEQFEMASEKYKQMLESGKISQELYEARINSMKDAKEKEALALEGDIQKIDDESKRLDGEIKEVQAKLEEINQKEIIYNEYGNVYYRLFGEVLIDRNKLDKNIASKKLEKSEPQASGDKQEKETQDENVVENKQPKQKMSQPKQVVDNNNVVYTGNASNTTKEAEKAEEKKPENKEEKKEEKVEINSKKDFKCIYKKLTKGTITDKELDALVTTLEKPENYDKYGISTGVVFNKARKILKYSGARASRNIESFIKQSGVFNKDIKFEEQEEKDNVLSHNMLNSWKDIDEKLVYTDSKFSVEKYIEQIEDYKKNGGTLTKEQEEVYNKAVKIKGDLSSYRKAINTNSDVALSRTEKLKSSPLYRLFIVDSKIDQKALPETSDKEAKSLSESLGNLVNGDPSEKELKTDSRQKTKEEYNIEK